MIENEWEENGKRKNEEECILNSCNEIMSSCIVCLFLQ